jgi:hypothetical protein
MSLVDVPMYVTRWLADGASGREYLGIAEGLRDVALRRVVSGRFADWRQEMPWMSLYFTVAVWLSLGMVRAPLPDAIGGRSRGAAPGGTGGAGPAASAAGPSA